MRRRGKIRIVRSDYSIPDVVEQESRFEVVDQDYHWGLSDSSGSQALFGPASREECEQWMQSRRLT